MDGSCIWLQAMPLKAPSKSEIADRHLMLGDLGFVEREL
jgi:hypothetical protein